MPLKNEAAFEITQKCSKLGWMWKQGGKIQTWKKRFFILKESALFYHKNAENLQDAQGVIGLLGTCNSTSNSSSNILFFVGAQVKQLLHLNNAQKFFFEIKNDLRSYTIYTDKQDEVDEWIFIIQKVRIE